MESKDNSSTWLRPYRVNQGGDALVLYSVFGNFDEEMSLDAKKYRSNGLPDGVDIYILSRSEHPEKVNAIGAGWLLENLMSTDPALHQAVGDSSAVLNIRGEVSDPVDLRYLRDIVGLLMATFDSGGVAILDWQALTWFSRDRWHDTIFEPNMPAPKRHVIILLSEEESEPDKIWVHTRGMRKFGRPDISIHNVTNEYRDAYIDLCERFIDMMALGEQVPDGQPITMRSLPSSLICRHAGDLDDPDFNNTHVEIVDANSFQT